MAYYEESIHLDLSKEIYSLEYTSLVPDDVVAQHCEDPQSEEAKGDFSTNAYLFFKEQSLIRKDTLNLCRYLELAYLEGADPAKELAGIPFAMLHTRVNQILQKYHEQPALLDKSSKFIILESMATVKKVLHRYVESYIQATKEGQVTPSFPLYTTELLKVLKQLIDIRGADRVTRHFPHEAQDFEPLIFLLGSRSRPH